jgi:hypothetical protein
MHQTLACFPLAGTASNLELNGYASLDAALLRIGAAAQNWGEAVFEGNYDGLSVL